MGEEQEVDQDRRPPDSSAATRVVGIGASAGGLESLQEFFRALPENTGLAFVIVQHLSTSFKSMMDHLLRRETSLPVVTVTDGITIEPNTVYLAIAGHDLETDGEHLRLRPIDPDSEQLNLPINVFFRSLAESLGSLAIGVVLSGTGTDGANGTSAIHAAGGLALVEDPGSARFSGMPQAAIHTGVVDDVGTPAEIARMLAESKDLIGTSATLLGRDRLAIIRDLLLGRFDVDIDFLRESTVARRVHRRREITASEDELTLDDYLLALRADPREQDHLFHDLFVNVTDFFRDREVFDSLREQILPELIRSSSTNNELRIWVAGCSTGQEAYSVTISVMEAIEQMSLARPPKVKIFATDIDPAAIAIASNGTYSREDLDQVPAPIRHKYFSEHPENRFVIEDRVREKIVFAVHNIIADAPFTRLDLITCRNVLIYFRQEAIQRALRVFAYSLKPHGRLCLGPSESTSPRTDAFAPVDENSRIFRVEHPVERLEDFRVRERVGLADLTSWNQTTSAPTRAAATDPNYATSLYEQLLARFMPPSFILDTDYHVVESIGGAESRLRVPAGHLSTEFLSLFGVGDTAERLTLALQHCLRTGERVIVEGVAYGNPDEQDQTDLTISRLENPQEGLLLLVSLRAPDIAPPSGSSAEPDGGSMDSLREDLRIARTELTWTLERLNTSSEQSQSAHEELVASNEELQSMNEELSSVNEELYTVNTEYQSTIQELRALNRDVDYLLESSDVYTVFLDRELRIRRFTTMFGTLFRVSQADVGRKLDRFTTVLKIDNLDSLMQAAAAKGKRREMAVPSIDGRTFLLRVAPYKDHDGDPDGCVLTLIDVTKMTKVKRKLEASEKRLKSITDALPVMMVYVDRDLRYRYVNQAYADAWRRPIKEMIGERVADIIGAENFTRSRPLLLAALEGRQTTAEFLVEIGGTTRHLLASYVPDGESEDDARPAGVYLAITDISSSKKAEAALEDAKRAADAANRSKSEFLANTSHEIRTPMTAILGFTELLAQRVRDDEAREFLDAIERNGRHLVALIDDILDLSKIEANKLQIEEERFRPAAMVADVMTMLRGRTPRTGPLLILEIQSEIPRWVEADPRRIRQILINLLGNAIKFTESGTIRLEVATEEGSLVFRVRDTGPGIPRKILERLFRPFSPGDSSSTKSAGPSTGLGLAISKRLAELIGGDLSVETELGVGSVFTLEIPLSNASRETEQPPADYECAERDHESVSALPKLAGKILVVDDQPDIRQLLERLLTDNGATVVAAHDGIDALRRVEESKVAGDHFDAILLDMQMPGVDGFTIAERLRAERHGMPIVAVTASAMRGERERCLAAGCSDYVSKPLHTPTLIRLLAAHGLRDAAELPSDSTSLPQPVRRAARVLIVEDDPDSAEAMSRFLADHGFNVQTSLNLRGARDRIEVFEPEVLVIDRKLSDGDGFEFAKSLKGLPEWADLRVVTVSGDVHATSIDADARLDKPVALSNLATCIQELLDGTNPTGTT